MQSSGRPQESITYSPAGPTLERFHNSPAKFRCVMGPYGSGKSVAMLAELVRLSVAQLPDKNGIRPTHSLVTRNTYPDLTRTTLATFKEWFLSLYRITMNPFPVAIAEYGLPDWTRVEHRITFMALEDESDEGKLRSLEITNAFVNEACLIKESHIDNIKDRLGRFPPKKRVEPTRVCFLADTNPPSTENWYYKRSEITRPHDWEFFKQPPGLLRDPSAPLGYVENPAAENIQNLGIGYEYYFQMLSSPEEQIKCRVMGEYSTFYPGKPVYPEYSDSTHCPDEPLEIYGALPIYIGWDFGNTPACVIGQLAPNGQLRILREYWVDNGYITMLADKIVMPDLHNTFRGMRRVSFGDPSGINKSQVIGISPIDALDELGIETDPAPCAGNRTDDRVGAMRDFFTKMVYDSEANPAPGILVDRSCKRLREAFKGGYLRRMVNTSVGGDYTAEKPEKNQFSHIMEAAQYMVVGMVDGGRRREHVHVPPALSDDEVTDALY